LPLPSEGYYFYPNGVATILSLAMIADTKRVFMDSAIDNMSKDTLVVLMTLDKSDQSIPYISDKPATVAVMRYTNLVLNSLCLLTKSLKFQPPTT
jgi:hypothetical protein